MEFKKGDTGTLHFADETSAKIVIKEVITYPASGMPPDFMCAYQEGETNKQLIHPDFDDVFPLPYFLLEDDRIFTKD